MMITEFKIFEKVEYVPEVGDYVVCKDIYINEEYLNEFLSNSVGKVVEINKSVADWFGYIIQYEDVPGDILDWFNYDFSRFGFSRLMRITEILFCSSDKEVCEAYLAGGRYNI